jgi:hypothetical protein
MIPSRSFASRDRFLQAPAVSSAACEFSAAGLEIWEADSAISPYAAVCSVAVVKAPKAA